MKKIEINEESFITICASADNMLDAARKTGLHPSTFRRKAKALGCYRPNQTNRPSWTPRELTKDEVTDMYLSNKKAIAPSSLRLFLIKHGFKEKSANCVLGRSGSELKSRWSSTTETAIDTIIV